MLLQLFVERRQLGEVFRRWTLLLEYLTGLIQQRGELVRTEIVG